MVKKQIVIGSLLKPVDDIRHYHKFALSLAKTNKYGFNIIGFNSKNHSSHPDIQFLPLFKFHRLSPARVLAQLRFLAHLFQLKPELVIVNTAELLAVSVLNRILFGGRLVYDLQENYRHNIRHLSPLPSFLKAVAAWYTRATERLCAPFIDHFILAENSYAALPFVGSNRTVIQNKTIAWPQPASRAKNSPDPTFLFSGTLSETYGLREAIDAFRLIQKSAPGSKLHFCGKVHDGKSLRLIQEAINCNPSIHLTGGADGVSHEVIRSAIIEADFGLVFYPDNPAINDCFPTKVWEYMAGQLPMVVQPGKPWTSYCMDKQAALVLTESNEESMVEQLLRKTDFYPASVNYSDIYWSNEEPKLVGLVDRLLG